MKKIRSSGFTLIELLVVISIIAILASLAIPAVTGALTKGQMMQTVSNGRQVHLACMNLSTEANSTGDSTIIAWPGDTTNGSVASSATEWYKSLNNVLSTNDLKKLFSAPGKLVSTWGTEGPSPETTTCFYVYRVTENSDSSSIFLTTKNWQAASASGPALDKNSAPYGDKGFVVVYRGGNANTYNKKQATNNLSSFFGSATNNVLNAGS